eukprot:TRINITY_DN667_c0_g1_i1.p1 TRINITY_DN667_c0_g1~~TRINITY_DN667_c0_g1_i1.p1  ORF type:complete len:313 (+),score=97.84 TRINITY_DN667_c0_g1_i1:989-1927(+)
MGIDSIWICEGPPTVCTRPAFIIFIDTYFRSGLYKANLPVVLGRDGAGIVSKIGPDVKGFNVGDRVAYFSSTTGSYAQFTAAFPDHVVKLPNFVSFEDGVAAMVSGLTAHYLVAGVHNLKKGDTILVHAAAGGLGQLLCQLGRHFGAKVIGTTSTEEKAKIAKEQGADEVILYTKEEFDVRVKEITQGRGVDVVFDSVGKSTWEKSLNSLKKRGLLALVGNSSGAVPLFDPLLLSQKGSLYVTRPTLNDFMLTEEEREWRTNQLFDWLQKKIISFEISKVFPLEEAAQAHIAIESRNTTGKLLLSIPKYEQQ